MNIRPICIMIYFDLLIIIFHHNYDLNPIKILFFIINIFYIPKIDPYLKLLTDEEVKDFVAINFSEYFKSIREEQKLRKVAKSLYIFLATPDEVEKYVQSNSCDNSAHHYNSEILNLFDSELQLMNTKPMIKN